MHFLCNNILNWRLNLHGKKKKPYLAKTLTEPIDLMALLSAPNPNANFACSNQRQQLTALWSNGIQASSEWQYSSPMKLGYPVGGGNHISGCPCHSWSQPCSNVVAVLVLIGAPSSWWCSRWLPSLPMPRNGTASVNMKLSRIVGYRMWGSCRWRIVYSLFSQQLE